MGGAVVAQSERGGRQRVAQPLLQLFGQGAHSSFSLPRACSQ
jgi:hypothetical protein